MRSNHKPCPICGAEMHRQSKSCRKCFMKKQSSPEARAHLSKIRKGKPSYIRTEAIKQKMSNSTRGKPKPWLLGKKRPLVGRKIAAWWTPERKEAARQRGLLMAENREWLVKIAEALSGTSNPNYQGKRQATPYAPGWGRGYRKKIRARAKGVCENCNCRVDYPLDLHHKDFSKDNHSPENLMVLCRSCHKLLHFANSEKT